MIKFLVLKYFGITDDHYLKVRDKLFESYTKRFFSMIYWYDVTLPLKYDVEIRLDRFDWLLYAFSKGN